MKRFSDSAFSSRSQAWQVWKPALHRAVALVVILALVLPGMAAARPAPPESERVLAYQFFAGDCGGPPPAAVPANWAIGICDKFDNNANGWLVGDESDDFARGSRTIAGGSYTWNMEAVQDAISTAWLPDRTFSDFYAAVDAAWVKLPIGVAQYGLQFRRLDADNFYLFTVETTGRQYSLQMVNRGQWETLIDWTENPAIQLIGANRLAVLAQGSSLTLFANGQQIAQYKDSRIAVGQVGLSATYDKGDRISARFDNFELRVPSGQARPASAPTTAPQPQPPVAGVCAHGQWLVDHGWTRVVCDDFATNANNWSVGDYDDQYAKVNRTIDNKLYKWQMETASGAANWAVLQNRPFTDFWVSTSAMMTSGAESGFYALIFRKIDDKNYYRFGVSETGHYRVDVYYQGQWNNLIDWSPSDAIRPGRMNDFAVLAEQSTFSFYINGQEVNSLNDERLTQGLVGLAMEAYAGETATLQFLDFEVVTPASQAPTPPSPVVTPVPAECDVPAGAPSGWQTVLCDQFLDNRNAWSVGVDTDAQSKVTRDMAAGTYGFTVEAVQDTFYWKPYAAQSFSDCYAAMSANVYTGKPETSYELVFRAADNDNYYIFSAGGSYFQVAVLYRNNWQELIPWTNSSAIRPGEFNQLAVLAQGPNLTFYINGTQVGNLTNNLIPAGKIGLGATVYQGDQASIQFDSILIMVPPGQSRPTPPPPPARPTSARPDIFPTVAPIPDVCGPVAVQDVQAWPVQVCETFDSNTLMWPEGRMTDDLGTTWRSFEDGGYRWQVEATANLVYSARYDTMLPMNDFYVAVDASRVSGPEDAEYGLQFRRTADGNWGIFSVTDTGLFSVDVYRNGAWESLMGWTHSDAIRPGQPNRLAVIGVGANLWFYINGQQVAQLEEARLNAGVAGVSIGLSEGKQATFKFDNFEARAPQGAAALPGPQAPAQPSPQLVLPLATQAAPGGELYQNADWGVSVTYPKGWKIVEESYAEYFSVRGGAAEQDLEVFEGNLDPSMVIVSPVFGVIGGDLTGLVEMPAPDASGRAPSAKVLQLFISKLGESFADTSPMTVGTIQPGRSADTEGSMAAVKFPNNLGRMYIAGFTMSDKEGAFLLVLTPENQQDAGIKLFNSTLASLRLGGLPGALTKPQTSQYGECDPPVNAPAGWQQVFCDPFIDNSNGWQAAGETEDEADVQEVIQDGVYRWTIEANASATVWGFGEGETYSDLHVAVDVPRVSGPKNDAFGLAFRGQDVDNYYAFVVTADSFLLAVKVDGDLESLIDWTDAPALRKGQTNHLEVTAMGPRITLYINGQKVGDVRDDRVKDGQVGLVALLSGGDQLDLEFDNLQILVPQT